MDVKFTQSTDGGSTWSKPVTVNDNTDAAGVPTDQFQASVDFMRQFIQQRPTIVRTQVNQSR